MAPSLFFNLKSAELDLVKVKFSRCVPRRYMGKPRCIDIHLRTALFWVITQRVVVTSYWRFGANYRSHLQRNSWHLKMGPIGCPQTSVKNHHYSLSDNLEERSSHLLSGGSLKSRLYSFIRLSPRVRWIDSFTPGPPCIRERAPNTHCIGDWVGPRAFLNVLEEKTDVYFSCQQSQRNSLPVDPTELLYDYIRTILSLQLDLGILNTRLCLKSLRWKTTLSLKILWRASHYQY